MCEDAADVNDDNLTNITDPVFLGAYLFNNGGPAESVSAEQILTATVQPGHSYRLTVAIGRC